MRSASPARSSSRWCGRPAWSTRRWRCARCAPRSTICCRRSRLRAQANERVLVTTLTKRMAEDLTEYLQRARREGALPALGHRDGGALGDHPRSAPGQVRRARRHQSAARGPGHARGVAGRDPRCRQGGLSALGRLADPDHRPRRAQRAGQGDPVCRPCDRLDRARHRGDRSAPQQADRVQRPARHHAAHASSRR